MAHEWIAAATALRYLSDETFTFNEQRAICERAHSGLIAAKADLLVWNGEEHRQQLIPKAFWWAEGYEALEQDWSRGDFSTWIDRKIEVKAFAVSFDFSGISELASADRRASGLQRISVAGDPQWIPAKELYRLVYDQNAASTASAIIVEASALGQLSARAMRATGIVDGKFGNSSKAEWAAREWDVPLWFWRDFARPNNSMQDWALGKARGRGTRNKASEFIVLQGLHFHRAGMPALGLVPHVEGLNGELPSNRGRRAKYDWHAASLAVFGQIHRGDFKPTNQAEIEKAMISFLANGDDEPSESTVRPYAKRMWSEFIKD